MLFEGSLGGKNCRTFIGREVSLLWKKKSIFFIFHWPKALVFRHRFQLYGKHPIELSLTLCWSLFSFFLLTTGLWVDPWPTLIRPHPQCRFLVAQNLRSIVRWPQVLVWFIPLVRRPLLVEIRIRCSWM